MLGRLPSHLGANPSRGTNHESERPVRGHSWGKECCGRSIYACCNQSVAPKAILGHRIYASVVELADTLALEASAIGVRVRVLPEVPILPVWWNSRHSSLKNYRPLAVRVRIPPWAPNTALVTELAYVRSSEGRFCGFNSHHAHQSMESYAAKVLSLGANEMEPSRAWDASSQLSATLDSKSGWAGATLERWSSGD